MNKEDFVFEVKKLGIIITNDILNKLDIYCDFLLEYNEHTNLTAIKEKDEVYLKHFYDSLTIVKVIDLTCINNVLDIGTGAGFPGMVLKIFFPHLHVTLVDSNNKKVIFLKALKEKLSIDDIEIINARIEDITKYNLNKYDLVTSRAVVNLPVLAEISLPLVKKGKYFIAMKGSNKEEIENGKYAISKLNGKIIEEKVFDLYNNSGIRTLLCVEKQIDSNINNLRPYDKIIKKPLKK